VPPEMKGQFDTVLINNPHGYEPNIEQLGEALRPGGRIIVQGRGPANKDFDKLFTTALEIKRGNIPPPKGFARVIIDGLTEAGQREPMAVLGGPFNKTAGT